jgi:thymidylate synthase (FAD)
MSSPVTLLFDPVVIPIAQQSFIPGALDALVDWVGKYRPECLPNGENPTGMDLFPHDGTEDGRVLTDNELLVELSGRNCYHSYGAKAGKKSNREYIAHTQSGSVPHRSIMYHAKMTFFIAGISRRMTHELIRHYVGADRSEEGSPSMESTRYTEHTGCYVVPPRIIASGEDAILQFSEDMSAGYTAYNRYIANEVAAFTKAHGTPPKGMDRKRIYEAATGMNSWLLATSTMWTANPVSLAHMFKEREDESADLEFQRLARVWRGVCQENWPNLFPRTG